ncbi:MAG: hypothetical protein P4L63_02530 [Candidatus Pacebacteria bacterium]|nr:hypothetical protein [Candidatus Paceibacterota bacterium]
MQAKLTKIFKKAKYQPSPDLAFSILNKMVIHNKNMAKFKLWIGTFTGIASLITLIPVFQTLLTNLSHSGFYDYFSLIFSDSGLMFSYWKEFTLSLAESLPMTSIIFTLSLVFIFLLSFRYVMKQISRNQFISFGTLSA